MIDEDFVSLPRARISRLPNILTRQFPTAVGRGTQLISIDERPQLHPLLRVQYEFFSSAIRRI